LSLFSRLGLLAAGCLSIWRELTQKQSIPMMRKIQYQNTELSAGKTKAHAIAPNVGIAPTAEIEPEANGNVVPPRAATQNMNTCSI